MEKKHFLDPSLIPETLVKMVNSRYSTPFYFSWPQSSNVESMNTYRWIASSGLSICAARRF